MKQAKLLTDKEFKRLSAVVDSLRHSTRNHTAIALSFYAGLRACEIGAILVRDVFDGNGTVKDTVYLSAAQTKGSHSCTVLVNKKLRTQLERYARAYPKRTANPSSLNQTGFTGEHKAWKVSHDQRKIREPFFDGSSGARSAFGA